MEQSGPRETAGPPSSMGRGLLRASSTLSRRSRSHDGLLLANDLQKRLPGSVPGAGTFRNIPICQAESTGKGALYLETRSPHIHSSSGLRPWNFLLPLPQTWLLKRQQSPLQEQH